MIIEAVSTGLRSRIRLRDGALVHTDTGGATRLVCPSGGQALGVLSASQRDVLDALAAGDCDEDGLLAGAADRHGGADIGRVYALLAQLRTGNWLAATLEHDGRPLLTLVPSWGRTAGDDPLPAADLLRDVLVGSRPDEHVPGPLVLSRFAQLRRDRDRMMLETPLAGVAVQVRDPALLPIVAMLAEPQPARPAPVVAGIEESAVATVIDLLVACRLVVPVGSAEDTDLELAQWSPHEMWFHTRSRRSRHESPWGATYWARDRGFDALPARHRPAKGPRVPLHRPDLDTVAARDPRLTDVLENRRSIREHDDSAPLTAAQLGEFLYRTARTRLIWERDAVELTDRPYPAGGALHELELYPVVRNVRGVAPGLYHYDGHAHELNLLAADSPLIRALGNQAARAATMSGPPQVLIVVTARFGRVMWKYQSMAYALILKHVGVLYSAMYLVASAMTLAPCALGGGDSDLFARASGLTYATESSVGEFVLGSARGRPGPHGMTRK